MVTGSTQAGQLTRGMPPALIVLRQGLEDLWRGRGARQRAGRRRPVDRPRRFRRHHGPVRLRQVDGDEHHRLPRYAERRALLASRASTPAGSTATAARMLRNLYIGFVFQGYNLLAAHHGGRECRAAADLSRRAWPRAARAAPCRRWPRSALAAASTTRRPSFPAASSSASPSRAPSSPALTLLVADEPTGNLDTARSHEIMTLLTALNRELGLTIVMVTHEPDIAAYAQRTIGFLDGHIESDTAARWRRPDALRNVRLALASRCAATCCARS